MLSKKYANMVEMLKEKIFSSELADRYRVEAKNFTRKRKLPFSTVILFLFNLLKGSLQDELDNFFKLLGGQDIGIRAVTKAAFCKARAKIKHDVFKELIREMVNYAYEHILSKKWNGYRVLAIDGSTVQVPETTADYFGVMGRPTKGQPCPVARISLLWDVLNCVTVDATMKPNERGERALASKHITHLGSNDLVLFDRGYPAFWLFSEVRQQGADFCGRMVKGVWNIVDEFSDTGLDEQIVQISPTALSAKKCHRRGISLEPMTVRLIRVVLDNGEVEILVTSLLDKQKYPHSMFRELYNLRWGIEEGYKSYKHRIQVENWTGKSVESVLQDFYAKIFTHNLMAIMVTQVDDERNIESPQTVHSYKTNRTQALSKMKDTVVMLFTKHNPIELLFTLMDVLVKTIEPIRKGRKFSRTKRMNFRQYSFAYKQIR